MRISDWSSDVCSSDLLTFDMGGTTAKLGAIDNGEPAILSSFEVDQLHYKAGSGLPLNISAIELLEIGAGGGSIAKTDMGLLKLGPESAGSAPGPICYGGGGTLPTITDRSEEHTSELQSLIRISYAVF